MDYKEKLKDPRWQKKRLQILERDDWKCQVCMNDKDMLIVHHKQYINGNDCWDYPNHFLITLCNKCHEKIHDVNGDEPNIISKAKSKYVNHIDIISDGFTHPAKLITVLYDESHHANDIVKKLRFIENHEGCWIFKTKNISSVELSVITSCFDKYCWYDFIGEFWNDGVLIFEDCFGTSGTSNIFNL